MSRNLNERWRAGLSGAFVVFTGVAVYWAALPERPPAVVMPSGVGSDADAIVQPEAVLVRSQAMAAPPWTQSTALIDTEAATVAQYTARKYQFLLDDLHVPRPDPAQLQRALLMREQVAGQPDSPAREDALAGIDARVRSMLHPSDFATYEALRESDLEQFQLEDYAAGISNVAPLGVDERKAILRTKLAYKGRFRQLARDSGLQRKDLSAAERDYAYGITASALNDYLRDYLQEVRQYLSNDEQYALLSNYENTEFTAELAKLRSMAGGS